MEMFTEKPKRGEINRTNANLIAVVVIVVGVILLLANLGIFSVIWPLALVGGGIWFYTNAKRGSKVEIKHEHYSADADDARSAHIKLSLPVGETTVRALDNSTQLIDADMNFVGEMAFDVYGEADKTVSLRQTGSAWQSWLNPENWNMEGKRLRSTIGLSKNVPLTMNVNGGVGRSELDLSQIIVNDLDINGGVGEIFVTLPTSSDGLDLNMQVGVGRMELTVPPSVGLNARIKGGVGETVIRLPADAAVRLEATSGIGDISVGSRFSKISGDNGAFGMGKNGVWQTSNFSTATNKVTIHFDGGIGQLSVR